MTDPTQKPETAATVAGNADAVAKAAGAVAAAPAAAAPKEPKAKKAEKAEKAEAPEATVVVTGPEKGRWRAGRKFTREPSSIPLGELKEGDLEKLQADPELFVKVVDAPH